MLRGVEEKQNSPTPIGEAPRAGTSTPLNSSKADMKNTEKAANLVLQMVVMD
jgi:hypothetical protein